ncbi:MAG TPA: hypothetical protein VGK18_10620 [Propionicimonas sp.]|uniref:hypothetical protein n=1 Tax=Propionicimonas sp. TaxID=1955623 RepID=UPI002F3FE227
MKRARAVLVAILGIVVVVALIAGGVVLWSTYNKAPLPIDERCVATAGGNSTTIDPEQARNAAIIAGMSIKRGLAPRAASIALATAYQESGIRNLDHGHADSIGLFQQRPSKGWGTIEQIMDPWYSTREFYRAMERIRNWRTKDINDVAQAVQRSAYPDAYRRHETNARTLASSLTGETPASFTCVVTNPRTGDPEGMVTFLKKTLGVDAVTTSLKDDTLTVKAGTPARAWAVAHLAIATTADYGLVSVQVGPYGWTHSSSSLSSWQGTGPSTATEVRLVFSTATPR